MTLGNPFNGPVFDQMFAEAVDKVTSDFITALPQAPSSADRDLYKQACQNIMLNTLNDVAFNGVVAYSFNPGADNSVLVKRVASESQAGPEFTETIISMAYTDSATGDIPNWFGNPVQAVQSFAVEKNQNNALKPNLIQQTIGNIFKPVLDAVGVSGAQAVMLVEIGLVLLALLAVAYFWRSFK